MTKGEATELIFGHHSSFDINSLESNYQSKYSTLQEQITHAPDVALKQAFQNKLLKLEQAYKILNSDNQESSSLPTLSPIPTKEETKTTPTEDNQVEAKIPQKVKPSFGEAIMNRGVFFTTLASLVLGLGMTILWFSAPSQSEIDALESTVKNKDFYIYNDLDIPIKIINYSAVYYDDVQKKMVRYNASTAKLKEKPIVIPAESKSRDMLSERAVTKDIFKGKVLFVSIVYAENVENPKTASYFADYVGDHVENGVIISPKN